MKKKRMALEWEGTLIELCMGRINRDQKGYIDDSCADLEQDIQSLWYDNTKLLQSMFDADNWWSVDDLDHAIGLVFDDRSDLETRLATMAFEIDGTPTAIDPEALQLSFYAPEAIDALDEGERVVCHGARRQAVLHLRTDFEPPFDPSLVTLSFLHYPDVGYILIDLDYDGHDDVQFSLGDTTYLKPRFFGKEHLNDTSS